MPLFSAQERIILEQAVANLRNGSEEALEYIHETFFLELVAYSAQLMNDREYALMDYMESAKDIVSPVFISVWERRLSFDSAGKLEGFLVTSTKNGTINLIRKRTIKRKYARNFKHTEVVDVQYISASNDRWADGKWQKTQLYYDIYKELEKLTPQEKQVLSLKLAGKEMEEIAQAVGVSLQAAFNIQYRAIKSLRNKLPDISLELLLFTFSINYALFHSMTL